LSKYTKSSGGAFVPEVKCARNWIHDQMSWSNYIHPNNTLGATLFVKIIAAKSGRTLRYKRTLQAPSVCMGC
jgi:hypothetical protein